jgi:adenosylhomocysteinase
LTGDTHVIRKEHFEKMKDGAIIANSGHFNVEINLDELAKMAKVINKGVREFVDEFVLPDGRRLYVLGEGRLINLAAAEGHPAAVMDMSFATQALATEFVIKNAKKLEPRVYNVPRDIENWIATLKLKSMGITIDELTPEQKKYLASWEMGT